MGWGHWRGVAFSARYTASGPQNMESKKTTHGQKWDFQSTYALETYITSYWAKRIKGQSRVFVTLCFRFRHILNHKNMWPTVGRCTVSGNGRRRIAHIRVLLIGRAALNIRIIGRSAEMPKRRWRQRRSIPLNLQRYTARRAILC